MEKEFEKYALNHLGVETTTLDGYRKNMGVNPYLISNSVSPNIIEERQMNIALMDVFSRLMMDRIIWCAGPVDDRMSTIFQAQLLFLAQAEPKKTIRVHVDSPGGSVKSGLGMVDVMDYVRDAYKTPIETINTGMAASMGSVLLGAGTKGMRSSLKHSRVMLHQSSGGTGGNIQDAKIQWQEWEKVNDELFKMLGEYCGKTAKQVKKDATRDFWLSSEEAYQYGIIDSIIGYSDEQLEKLKNKPKV